MTRILEKFDFIETFKLDTNHNTHAYYRVYANIKKDYVVNAISNKQLRDEVIDRLNNAGVPCFSGSCSEIYLEKAFESLKPKNRLINSQFYSENAFCLLSHHTITDEELHTIIKLLEDTLSTL